MSITLRSYHNEIYLERNPHNWSPFGNIKTPTNYNLEQIKCIFIGILKKFSNLGKSEILFGSDASLVVKLTEFLLHHANDYSNTTGIFQSKATIKLCYSEAWYRILDGCLSRQAPSKLMNNHWKLMNLKWHDTLSKKKSFIDTYRLLPKLQNMCHSLHLFW